MYCFVRIKNSIFRSYYQTFIWVNSHLGEAAKKDPLLYGWTLNEDNCIVPKMMNQAPVPEDIWQIISLFCNDKSCNTQKCQCKKEGVFCSTHCKCKINCNNVSREVAENQIEADDPDDDAFLGDSF